MGKASTDQHKEIMGKASIETKWKRLAQRYYGIGWHRDNMGKVKIKPKWKR